MFLKHLNHRTTLSGRTLPVSHRPLGSCVCLVPQTPCSLPPPLLQNKHTECSLLKNTHKTSQRQGRRTETVMQAGRPDLKPAPLAHGQGGTAQGWHRTKRNREIKAEVYSHMLRRLVDASMRLFFFSFLAFKVKHHIIAGVAAKYFLFLCSQSQGF